MTDKSKELTAKIQLLNQKLHFKGQASDNEAISIDYISPLGDNLGYTSLELFLLSLSSCAGSAILVLLRKMNKNIDSFEIISTAKRKEEHPTGFKSIEMQIILKSTDITTENMDKVLAMMHGICPVLSMIDPNVEINFKYKLNE